MAKKTKKKTSQSHLWSALKWTAAIGGGAVVGAYAVRFVDRHLKLQPGAGVPGDEPMRENPGLPEAASESRSESPLSNPLAMQVVSPIMPVPVPVPSFGGSMFGFGPSSPPPPPGHVYDSTVTREEQSPIISEPQLTARQLRQKRRAEKEREFEELVKRFEEDE